MLDIGRKTKGGRRVAAAGIVAALAAPSSLIVGSDALMALAILGFCACVVAAHRPEGEIVALSSTALGSVVCLVCVPAAPGIMQHALAFAFSCGCIAIASMVGPHDRPTTPFDEAGAA